MNLKKSILLNISLGIIVALALLFLYQAGLLKRLEFAGLDFSFRLKKHTPANPHIVIVEISDSDIEAVGRWPWKRSWHAAMTRALTGLGVKYIYFDMLFSEPASDEDDSLLEQSIALSKNVYLPFVFQDSSFDLKKAFLPLPRFIPYLKGTGAFNIYPDIDGITRRIPLVFPGKDKTYPHAALQIALDYLGTDITKATPEYLILSGPAQEIKVPLVEDNKMLVSWPGRWEKTFKHYSFVDILAAYQETLEGKKPKINVANFKESICLVALTAIGLYDIKAIPIEPQYPGIGIFAATISDIIDKKFIRIPPAWVNILILYILALLPAFLMRGDKPLRETFYVFIIAGAYLIINLLLFQSGVWLDFSLPLLGLVLSSFSIGTYNFVRVAMERQNFLKMSITDGLTGLYNIRYFKMLLETETLMAKHDLTKKFAIIMSDIDHFKHFNDTYGHQVGDLVLKETANILRASVRSSDIVARYGGEEMIMLLRGSPLKDGLSVAEKIRKTVEDHRIKNEAQTYNVTISMGVAIFKAGDTAEMIIKKADEALYQAKESGRNRVATLET